MPLTEAFYKRLPVVAYAATAVPATMDGAGVLYEDRDPTHVAGLIDAVLDDAALYESILAVAGRRARSGFEDATSPARCCGSWSEALRRPRHAAAEVSFDFWDQFCELREAEGAAAVPAGCLSCAAVRGQFGMREPAVGMNSRDHGCIAAAQAVSTCSWSS